jgi:Domain of unknown function (DUF4203)
VMLPQTYELPAALFLLLGGAVSCFAGYRLFKIVLGIYGFILGAGVASSAMGASNTAGMVIAALVGGFVGALILVFAYFVGIALVGAGLGALVVHVGWGFVRTGDPPAIAVIVLSVLGAIGAMVLQRYVIIVGTAFGGAWTMILGGLAVAGDRAAAGPARAGAWILYPVSPMPGAGWVPLAWIALGLAGTAVQLGVTGRKR